MTRPTLIEGVAVALTISLATAGAQAVLTRFPGQAALSYPLFAFAGLAYLLYLLLRGPGKAGRTLLPPAWLASAVVLWAVGAPPLAYLLTQAVMIWLGRSLQENSGSAALLADLGLNLLAVVFALWAFSRSGNPALTIWCFLLLQATSSFIPAATTQKARQRRPEPAVDAFLRARSNAEKALQKMSSNH